MAAPHVTGVSALLKAQDGARDWRVIKNLILSGGDRVARLEDRTISGSRLSALGALTCVERPLLARLRPVGLVLRGSVGTPIDLAALHVNCGNPNGDVLVNVFPGNGIIRLLDDGASPDQAAADGIYSGQWTPSAEGLYLLEYPGGDVVAVAVGAVASSYVPHFDQGEEWWTGLTLANPGGERGGRGSGGAGHSGTGAGGAGVDGAGGGAGAAAVAVGPAGGSGDGLAAGDGERASRGEPLHRTLA